MRQRHLRAKSPEQPPAPAAPVAPAVPVAPEAPMAAHTPAPQARPLRNLCLPQRYHNGNTEQDTDTGETGEYIDIHGDSDDASDDSQLEQGPRRTMSPTTTAVNTAITDPLATGQSSQSGPIRKAKNVTYDIHHFFRRGKERTLCLPCE